MFMCALAMIFAISPSAHSRPVSYPGGWTFMTHHSFDKTALMVHYTTDTKHAFGYVAEYNDDKDWQFHGVLANYLAKRWNMPNSQANFYINSAAGVAYSDYRAFDGKTEAAGYTGISFDWEDRRFFTMYENRLTYAGDIEKSIDHMARLGVAPYIGDYGDVHSWLMLQADLKPNNKQDEWTITPLVRFFKDIYLLEVGVSDQGEGLVNFVVRF